ncbi:MAG: antibiotic biosynthesis monooxygenase [Nitrospirae bacterium]|nr:antibiotic biosynthesis monooxygenase [Nitrospirota bacterium]
MSKREYTVSALARMASVSPDSIRHYERIGILPPAKRSPAGYRLWNPREVQYLKWLAPAKRAGFTLRELAEVFRMYRSGTPPCRTVRDVLQRKLIDLDAQSAELSLLRTALQRVLTLWNARLRNVPPTEFVSLFDDLASLPISRKRKASERLNKRRQSMIYTVVRFSVQPEKAQAFESVHRKLVEFMRTQLGCLEIKVHRSLANPLEYVVYGTWASKQAWQRAHQTKTFKMMFKGLPLVEHTLSRESFFELAYAVG